MAINKPDGVLSGMTARAIEVAAHCTGERNPSPSPNIGDFLGGLTKKEC